MTTSLRSHDKNLNLRSAEVKNEILKYLYSSGINVNSRHEKICNSRDLDNIRDSDYVICPKFRGTRTWVIFFHSVRSNVYYAVNFPKHSQRKREDIVIHPIEINVDTKFYHGTIMEGIYYKDSNTKYLIIDEVYVLGGENQLLKSKDDRLNYLSTYFKDSIRINLNYSMIVTQYYLIGKKSLKELYDSIKKDTRIQEIIFYPQQYGKKIYLYTIIDTDLIDNVIKTAILYFQKTSTPDVYNLLSCDSKTKIGMAYIPDTETSKKCKEWFKLNKKAKELIVKCRFDMVKKLWIPIELVEEDIIEISESNSE